MIVHMVKEKEWI